MKTASTYMAYLLLTFLFALQCACEPESSAPAKSTTPAEGVPGSPVAAQEPTPAATTEKSVVATNAPVADAGAPAVGRATELAERLREAAFSGDLRIVKRLAGRGANVSDADADGRTALMLASFHGHLEVIRFLLEKGAAVKPRDASGRTALMYASTGPFPETVQALAEAGSPLDSKDAGEGWTALMFAAGEGHASCVRVLLDAGADPTLTDADGDPALSFAKQRNHREVIELLQAKSGPAER